MAKAKSRGQRSATQRSHAEELKRKFPPPPSRWSDALTRMQTDGTPDAMRREVLREINAKTGRGLLVYASAFHVAPKAMLNQPDLVGLVLADIGGFREVIADLEPGPVDLVLHTPGGLAEAAEGIGELLRAKFTDVRVIVPLAAKSAGTILAMSANSILTLPGAELGPIDPQFVVQGRFVPARAIEKQFDRAVTEISEDARRIPAWVPLLSTLGPTLLEECKNALALSRGLVSRWLEQYMFAGQPDAKAKAEAVATFLSDYEYHLSHGRRIGVDELRARGVNIANALEVSAELDDLLSRLWLAIDHTLSGTDAYKIFENHKGQGIFSKVTVERPA
ncbi:MAG: serine protease [Chloroflexi bacterium]|nr:serine protease [Chloroflexota bacterium]